MELVAGLVLPFIVLALVGLRRDPSTHPRFLIGPLLAAVLAVVAVLTTDAGNTPDFWRGLCAALAAIAAAGAIFVLQSFMPLHWWLREPVPRSEDPPG